jgi:hypothetical protein
VKDRAEEEGRECEESTSAHCRYLFLEIRMIVTGGVSD